MNNASAPLQRKILLVGSSGYVGSRLAHDMQKRGWILNGCDPEKPADGIRFSKFHQGYYQDIPEEYINSCDAVLWFAGHSSVKLAKSEPWKSFENNIFDLAHFFRRIGSLGKPVIYASSASVLSSSQDSFSYIANEISDNPYDAGKLAFDLIAPHIDVRSVALRMATVSGWSPHIRWDLVFNAMNKSACFDKVIRVQNPSSFRSLLFIEDLSTFIDATVENIIDPSSPSPEPKAMLGSWSGTIGLLAAEIADYWHVPLEFQKDSGTYSFILNDQKLRNSFESPNSFYKSIRQRCQLFATQNEWAIP